MRPKPMKLDEIFCGLPYGFSSFAALSDRLIDCRAKARLPQNAETVNTSDLVRRLALAQGKKIRLTRLFNPALKFLRRFSPLVDKAFGSLRYDMSLSDYRQNYRVATLDQSLRETIGKDKAYNE